jgi:thiol-disulfide isomerase/thioredoxin
MRARFSLLLGLAACSTAHTAPPPAAPAAPADAPAAPSAPDTDWTASWTSGTPAKATADALKLNDPVPVLIPDEIARRVGGPTALFYFSPTCPHCQSVMPEVNRLAAYDDIAWIGIASGSATQDKIDGFAEEYDARFPLMSDAGSAFAQAVGARSTPSVYLVRPLTTEEPPVNADFIEGGTAVDLFEAYAPFGRGAGPVLRMRAHPEDPFRDFGSGFQGDRVCSVCHVDEAMSWALTHHAVAYRTLYVRDRAQDLACVGCHVTGMGQPGGFEAGDHGSPLTDVTCEACHGAAGPHDGHKDDPTAACQGCHDAEHSIAFSLDKGVPLLDHFKATELDEAAIRQRLQDLASGDADKPLLAFPAGETVGAGVCQECHGDQHKWWRKDAHARAMGSLKGEEATDPGCVRCHATPTALTDAGMPAGEGVAAFRTSEGVGCESCHGPGGAHAAAPSKGNIVGLGDSCPECVIEAVCTSCHVPKWDPGWDLDTRIDAVHH